MTNEALKRIMQKIKLLESRNILVPITRQYVKIVIGDDEDEIALKELKEKWLSLVNYIEGEYISSGDIR